MFLVESKTKNKQCITDITKYKRRNIMFHNYYSYIKSIFFLLFKEVKNNFKDQIFKREILVNIKRANV
jgi:hypothetical protein